MTSIRSALLATLVAGSTVGAQQLPDSVTRAAVGRQHFGDSILAIGAMAGWTRRERGVDVGTLDAERDDLNRAPSLPIALQGRIAGVSVSQGQGFLGSTSRVWLRGPSSLAVNEPLLIIDGVRAHSIPQPFALFPPRELPSRLEDIDPESIERVEILRGAAAAAIHGPGASRGVVVVTTKRGHQGPARWSAFAESGPMMEVTEFPANFGTLGVSTATGAAVANCPLSAQAAGTCTATTRQSWNPLESASPFRTGWTTGAGLAVAGGAPDLTYRVGANHDRSSGVYRNDHGSASSAHAAIGLAPASTVDVRFSGAYRGEGFRHPTADFVGFGMTGSAVDDPVRRGYRVDVGEIDRARNEEDGRRITGAFNATWRARPGLRASAVIGYDEVRSKRSFRDRLALFTPPGAPPPTDSATLLRGSDARPAARTAGIEVEATYRYLGAAARTAVGVQYLRDDDREDTFEHFIPDDPTGPSSSSGTHSDLRRVSTGLYARQHVGWHRVFATGAIRADLPKGRGIANAYSPSVDLSWIVVDNAARGSAWVNELRLRGAYGRGGGHLIFSAEVDNSSFFGLGPSTETAERTTEIELGADLSLFARRLQAGITVYRATNDQGLIMATTPPGIGGGQPYLSNDARLRTSGIEASVHARLVDIPGLAWDMGLEVAAHDHEVRSLPGAPMSFAGGGQRIQEGESIGEYHPGDYTFADANGDGLIAPSEVQIEVDESPSAGSPFPTYEAGLRTEARLGRGVRVAVTLDRRSGQKLYSATERVRCAIRIQCEAQHDPETTLAEQAAAVASQSGALAGLIEDASYTKLREASIAVALPRAWSGAANARLTVSGRNLFTWTSYRGLDPEITTAELNGFRASGDFFQPPLRSFTARLDLSW